MAKVLGLGGVFFKSENPEKLVKWYSEHLGFPLDEGYAGASFKPEQMPKSGLSVWSAFSSQTDYFGDSGQTFMFNLIVDDLEGALKQVEAGGAKLEGAPEHFDYGSFGWFTDPDGNKVELWQPA